MRLVAQALHASQRSQLPLVLPIPPSGKAAVPDPACPAAADRDPTYAVARAMAAPVLQVRQDARTGDAAGHAEHAAAEPGPEGDPDTPRSFASESSSGLDTPTRGARPLEDHPLNGPEV